MQKVVIFGAGNCGRLIAQKLIQEQTAQVLYFVDNDPAKSGQAIMLDFNNRDDKKVDSHNLPLSQNTESQADSQTRHCEATKHKASLVKSLWQSTKNSHNMDHFAFARNDEVDSQNTESQADSKAAGFFNVNVHNLETQQGRSILTSGKCLSSCEEKSGTLNVDSKAEVSSRDFAFTGLHKTRCNSKILDEKCGLQETSQRSYLEGCGSEATSVANATDHFVKSLRANDCRDDSPLPHLSLKAELPLTSGGGGYNVSPRLQAPRPTL